MYAREEPCTCGEHRVRVGSTVCMQGALYTCRSTVCMQGALCACRSTEYMRGAPCICAEHRVYVRNTKETALEGI